MAVPGAEKCERVIVTNVDNIFMPVLVIQVHVRESQSKYHALRKARFPLYLQI